MYTIDTLTIGTRIRVMGGDYNEVVGGGVLTAIDHTSVTVDQPYTHRHNGVIIEQGTTPARYSLINHRFERVA